MGTASILQRGDELMRCSVQPHAVQLRLKHTDPSSLPALQVLGCPGASHRFGMRRGSASSAVPSLAGSQSSSSISHRVLHRTSQPQTAAGAAASSLAERSWKKWFHSLMKILHFVPRLVCSACSQPLINSSWCPFTENLENLQLQSCPRVGGPAQGKKELGGRA